MGLVPRAVYKPSDASSLTVDGLLQGQRFDYVATGRRDAVLGSQPTFDQNNASFTTDTLQARLGVGWKAPLWDDGRLDLKLNGTLLRRRLDYLFDGSLGGVPRVARTLGSNLQDTSLAWVGKYSLALTDSHSMGAGWDVQSTRRREVRVQRETSASGFETQDLDEDFAATVNRLTFYVQDEWAVSKSLSGYFGVRWEALATRTLDTALDTVRLRSNVLSPTMQWLWKVPGTKSDQVRLGLGRTYKAPTPRDLIPRRWLVADNSPTSPYFQGDPNLVPELAWGLDLGYEHYAGADVFLGANVYARKIEQVILTIVSQESDGKWVARPVNRGNATVMGVELEAKAKLNKVWPAAPDVDFRAGLGRHASKVDAVPGPGNRLSRQPPLTSSLGVDYRMALAPVTLGGSFNFERQSLIRTSSTESLKLADKRGLDLYGVWRVGPRFNVRATLNNFLQPTASQFNAYADGSGSEDRLLELQTHRSLRLSLEFKL